MNPQDNLPGSDDYGFLDEWENEAQQQPDPLAKNPLDPLSDMLDTAEQQIEGTAPINPAPPDLPPDVSPDESDKAKEEAPSDMGEEGDKDNVDFPRLTEGGTADIGPSWGASNIKSVPPLFGIYNERGRRPHIPPTRLSRGRGGAGLGHSAGRDSMWCPKQQDYVNTEDCHDCEYYNAGEQDPYRRCTHPDQE
jgi:hypothetical protein